MSQTLISRTFMVQQATLLACAEMFPASVEAGRLPETLSNLGYHEAPLPPDMQLFKLIRREFARLSTSYAQVAA